MKIRGIMAKSILSKSQRGEANRANGRGLTRQMKGADHDLILRLFIEKYHSSAGLLDVHFNPVRFKEDPKL